jgi:hypothetical protein
VSGVDLETGAVSGSCRSKYNNAIRAAQMGEAAGGPDDDGSKGVEVQSGSNLLCGRLGGARHTRLPVGAVATHSVHDQSCNGQKLPRSSRWRTLGSYPACPVPVHVRTKSMRPEKGRARQRGQCQPGKRKHDTYRKGCR